MGLIVPRHAPGRNTGPHGERRYRVTTGVSRGLRTAKRQGEPVNSWYAPGASIQRENPA
jgi:hypothetical protein